MYCFPWGGGGGGGGFGGMFSNLLWLTACHAASALICQLETKSNLAGQYMTLHMPKRGEFSAMAAVG